MKRPVKSPQRATKRSAETPARTRKTVEKSAAPPAPPAEGGKPKRLRLRLATASDVVRELAKVYREARAGALDVDAASKLANVLSITARLIEIADFEQRLERLESQTGKSKENGTWATRH